MKFFLGMWMITMFVGGSYAKIINYPRAQGITGLDPASQWNHYTSEVLANIYEGLVKFRGETYRVSPLLSTRWEMREGGRVWRFYLRRGVKFHDGSPFTADSVVFTFKRQKGSHFEARRFLLSFLRDVEKVDDYTVDFKLGSPCPLFPRILANPLAYIVKPYRGKFLPIGTGPFKLEAWNRGKFVLLKANENYWGRKPFIDGVRFSVVSNPYSRVLQLRNGNADVISRLSRKEYEDVKDIPTITVWKFPLLNINFITFNIKKPPFDDIRVRKAVTYLINRRKLVKLVFGELAEPVFFPLPPSLSSMKGLPPVPEYDPEKGKKLLQEAGYGKGLRCTLYYLQGSPFGDVASVLSRSLVYMGVIIKPVGLSRPVLTHKVVYGDFEMALGGWVADCPDPGNFLYSMLFPFSFRARKSNSLPEVKKLLILASTTPDGKKRREIYLKVVRIIMSRYVTVPLFRSYLVVAHRREIKGLKINPKGYLIFSQVRAE